jgi:hypothetical protein
MRVATETGRKIVYWHRELPPLPAEAVTEHVLEADSAHIPGTIAHRDELWSICYHDLLTRAQARLEQEVARLGGDYARVFDESIDSRHDDVKGETWLRGRFKYVLYRQRG